MQSGGMQKTEAKSERPRRKRRSRAQWAAEIGEWRRTGLEADAYAVSKGLNPRTFVWWIRELREPAQGSASVAANTTRGKGCFLPVRVVGDAGQRDRGALALMVEIDLANGRRLRLQVQRDEDVQRVAALVDAVEGGL